MNKMRAYVYGCLQALSVWISRLLWSPLPFMQVKCPYEPHQGKLSLSSCGAHRALWSALSPSLLSPLTNDTEVNHGGNKLVESQVVISLIRPRPLLGWRSGGEREKISLSLSFSPSEATATSALSFFFYNCEQHQVFLTDYIPNKSQLTEVQRLRTPNHGRP